MNRQCTIMLILLICITSIKKLKLTEKFTYYLNIILSAFLRHFFNIMVKFAVKTGKWHNMEIHDLCACMLMCVCTVCVYVFHVTIIQRKITFDTADHLSKLSTNTSTTYHWTRKTNKLFTTGHYSTTKQINKQKHHVIIL